MTQQSENGDLESGASFHEKPAPIESLLAQVLPEQREEMLRMLLRAELEQCRQSGETPRKEVYLERFPEYVNCVEGLFTETLAYANASVDTDSMTRTIDVPLPTKRRIGDYVVESELGRGGMGVVYQVRHASGGEPVALKLLPSVDGASLHRFKQEFRSIAEASHLNLIGLHSLESDGEQWFITMELLRDPKTFRDYVRPRGAFHEKRLRQALPQLLAGIKALHDHGVIHRDLKPSNVMVDADGRVVLLDFGLVSDKRREHLTLTEQRLSGTPAYMAPELSDYPPAAETHDWYAVGVMLYESLCGELPFQGGVLQMLTKKKQEDAPPLPNREELPDDLAELCMALLHRDPSLRPGCAEISRSLSFGKDDVASPSQPMLALTGRQGQLQQLNEHKRWFDEQQQPLTIFIQGRSGEGKSVLADAFLEPIQEDESVALISGRCYDRESVPFKALDSLIDGLCSYLRQLPETEAASLMPREVSLLAKVFPVLLRVSVVADMPQMDVGQLDEQQVRTRAFAALRELFGRISDRTPVVAFIDDLQWGDADSAEVLLEVLRPPMAPRVMLVGTYRSDEAEGSAFLRKWDEFQRSSDIAVEQQDVSVGPFSQQQCIDILTQIAGTAEPRIVEMATALAHETGGNPYLFSEAISAFDQASQTLHDANLLQVITKKLEQLPAQAKLVLELISTSGQSILIKEVFRAMGRRAWTTPC